MILIIFLTLGLIVSLGLNVAAFILVRTLLAKISVYEKWIVDFKEDLSETVELMRDIDKQGVFATSVGPKGVFESDDQVGQIFKDLLDLVEKLNERIQ